MLPDTVTNTGAEAETPICDFNFCASVDLDRSFDFLCSSVARFPLKWLQDVVESNLIRKTAAKDNFLSAGNRC